MGVKVPGLGNMRKQSLEGDEEISHGPCGEKDIQERGICSCKDSNVEGTLRKPGG